MNDGELEQTQGLALHIVLVALRLLLVFGLVGAGWAVYRSLPPDAPTPAVADAGEAGETKLSIVLRRGADDGAIMAIPVELYPIDISAVQHEFMQDPHPGVRFNDYLARRMRGRASIKTRLDEHGRTTVMVSPGKWWLQATLAGIENLEWRLSVNVAGRQQTIDLTSENAYARSKSF